MRIAPILSLTTVLTSAPALPMAQAADKPATTQDIVAVATGAGSFKTLVAAISAAGTVEGLLKPENQEQLAAPGGHPLPGQGWDRTAAAGPDCPGRRGVDRHQTFP